METQNQDEKIIIGKTLIVSPTNHKILSLKKVEGDYPSIDKLISNLLENENKVKELELKVKELESKLLFKQQKEAKEKKKNGK